MLCVIALRCGKKPVHPWQEFLSAVISVEDHRNTVLLGHSSDMECSRHGTSNGSSVIFVVESFPTVELDREDRNFSFEASLVYRQGVMKILTWDPPDEN